MFIKIFLKEWRENIILFSIAILLMLATVALSLSNLRQMTLYFSGMFLLFFLPFASLLIGSGGFYSEFKDNAWIYFFSRPIKKWQIWVFKYISLLSILFAIFLIFILIRQFLPGLGEILEDISFPSEVRGLILKDFRGLFSLSLYLVLPLLAFTISFSISILSEKQFVTFFVSILLGTGLAFIFQRYLYFLWTTYYYYENFKIFPLFMAFSFILASLLTFLKADFSQKARKIIYFSKLVVLFLILSFALGTVWVAKGALFTGSREFYPESVVKHQGDVYINAIHRGLMRYDSKADKVKSLRRKADIYWNFSIAVEKIAFLKNKYSRNRYFFELWIINTSGSQAKALIDSRKQDSPFYDLESRGRCLLSPDGKKIVFATGPRGSRQRNTSTTIWWMNTDGTELRSQAVDFPPYKDMSIIAWPPSKDYLILLLEEITPKLKSIFKLIKVDLEGGAYQVLVENVITVYEMSVSPAHDSLALCYRQPLEKREILAVLNLETLEKREVLKTSSLKLWAVKWNSDGDKIIFSREKEFWVYSLAEDKAQRIGWRSYSYEVGFDWLLDGKRLVLSIPVDGEYYLQVLKEDFSEEKKIKIPYPIQGHIYLWGLDNKVLMKFQKGPLFRLDLESANWKKVY
jgi:Tol biopolymer transport system component